MILFYFGPDTFRSRQKLRESIDQFKKQRDPQGYNVVILDAKKIEPGEIFSEIFATPFLAAKRLIVVENVLSNNDKEFLSAMIQKIKDEKLSENNIIIFWQGEPPSKVKEAKELQALLSKEKYAQEFALLTGNQLTTWIVKEAQIRGVAINLDATNYLAQHAGQDVWLVNSLLNQLAAYVAAPTPRPIAMPDIQLFLDEKIDDNIFTMIDAVVAGNRRLAFKLLEEQRRQGEEEGHLFGLLLWQLRILLEIADLLEREGAMPSDVVAKKLTIHPFVAKKNFVLAKKYSLAKLQLLHQKLLNIDIKTKTGEAPQSLLIDLFIATI